MIIQAIVQKLLDAYSGDFFYLQVADFYIRIELLAIDSTTV
jgi:hypothetical protein